VGVLPREIEQVLELALVSEFTVIGPRNQPISHPMIPLYDGEHVYLHSSILFSKKLDHVRRNPKVSVAVTDLNASHKGPIPHRVCIQGDAALYEGDIHREWQRILPLWIDKEPIVQEFFAKRVALPLFWERVIIEITPRRALLWEAGRTDRPPKVFQLEPVT
jgi:general stress protein 26